MPSKAAAGKLLETPGSRQKRIESIKLFLFIVPCLALVFVFHYMPLWGWIYAFFQYKPGMALANCKFVGFQNFTNLFGNPVMRQNLFRVLRNTLGIQFINYLLMPVPMLFAIFLSEIKSTRFQKCVQTLTTLPHFISWVIMFSLMSSLFGSSGLVNALMQKFGAEMTVNILTTDKHVWLIQALLYTWKNLGWNAIIYFAAITGLDQEVNEAAMIDGANRWQQIVHVTLPSLLPTIITLTLMSIGKIFYSDFGLFYQVPMDSGPLLDITSTIDTYVYRALITLNDYGRSSAAGVYQSVVGFILVLCANLAVKKIGGEENALF